MWKSLFFNIIESFFEPQKYTFLFNSRSFIDRCNIWRLESELLKKTKRAVHMEQPFIYFSFNILIVIELISCSSHHLDALHRKIRPTLIRIS